MSSSYVTKPIASAATAATITAIMGGFSGPSVQGYTIPSPLIYGAIAGASTGMEDIINDMLFKKVFPEALTGVPEIANPLASGVASLGLGTVLRLIMGQPLYPGMGPLAMDFGIGAGSRVVGDIVQRSIDPIIAPLNSTGGGSTPMERAKAEITEVPGLYANMHNLGMFGMPNRKR